MAPSPIDHWGLSVRRRIRHIEEPGIKLSWITRAGALFANLHSIPARVGTDIHRFEQTDAGHYGKNATKVGELVLCSWDDQDDIDNCLRAGTVEPLVWSFLDETAEAGVSYSYWVKPYQEFFSNDGVNKWEGQGYFGQLESGDLPVPPYRVREYSNHDIVRKRLPLDGEPGSPKNLDASQPNSGGGTGNCVRLTWDAADNATYYKVLGADGSVKHAPRIDAPDTTFDHENAELGQTYYYRVVAFTVYTDTDGEGNSRTRTLRSAGDALATIYLEDASVPKKVLNLTATPMRRDNESADVHLTWKEPEGFDTTNSNNGYVVEYRLDVPDHAEWDNDWKPLRVLTADKRSILVIIPLEAWNTSGDVLNLARDTTQEITTDPNTGVVTTTDVVIGIVNGVQTTITTTEVGGLITQDTETKFVATTPIEWVPTDDKGTLNLHNTDTSDDWMLPFGITYEYRIRAVTPTKKGPWTIISVRIPNQDGVPGTVKNFYPAGVFQSCLQFRECE